MIDCNKEKQGKKESCEHQDECLKMIQRVVDGEASAQELEHYNKNMSVCTPCEKAFELETCLKQAIKLRIEKKCVPMSLIDCIKKSILGSPKEAIN
jgi:hypothetical protein